MCKVGPSVGEWYQGKGGTGHGLSVKALFPGTVLFATLHSEIRRSRDLHAPCHAPDLSEYNPDLHRRVLESPGDCIPPFAEALEDMIRNQSPKVGRGGWVGRHWRIVFVR